MVITTMIVFNSHDPSEAVTSGFTYLFMTSTNLSIALTRGLGNKPDATIYLLIRGVLILVGFSVCTYQSGSR
jgi:hypothetical protein